MTNRIPLPQSAIILPMSKEGGVSKFLNLDEPSDERWNEFIEKYNGEFVPGQFFKEECVRFPIDHWTVTLDTTVTMTRRVTMVYSRLRTRFENFEGFRFKVTEKYPIHTVMALFGAGKVETGDSEFDRAFFVRGNDEAKVSALFDDDNLREMLRTRSRFMVVDIRRRGLLSGGRESELRLRVWQPNDDLDVMVTMFTHFLRRLKDLGVAT